MNLYRSFKSSVSTSYGKALTMATVVALVVVGVASPSFALGSDPVTSAFTSGQTSLTTYIGLGIAVVAAILLLGIGVSVLVKYLRKAARAA
jgi:hypothetical protein